MIFPLIVFAIVFWIVQIIDLLLRDVAQFESHTHKLLWFVAFMVGNIVAAIWYYNWKKSISDGELIAV